MKRRQFITLLGGAATWPLAARAQQLSKLPRIGFLQRVRNENVVAFIQALRDAGYVDGQNATIETRIFETTLDRVPDFAKELVDLKCDVILAASQYAFVAAMKATTTIPIVGIDLENDPVASGWVKSIIALAARHKLPTIYFERLFVAAGGLISHGPNEVDQYRQAAGYVDRILRGEKPADLPVQAPNKYETALNLKTAKVLGLTVPPPVLARA